MSLMDKVKSFFSGGSTADAHDHAGHDHSGHDHDHDHGHDHDHSHEPAAAMPPVDPPSEDRPV